jgi:hypothetical protein
MGGRQENEKESGPPCRALAGQSSPGELIQAEAEAIPKDSHKYSQDTPAIGRN